MVLSRTTSASIDQLFNAFRSNPDIPSKDTFIKGLQAKIESDFHLRLDLRGGGDSKSLDVKPPAFTGRLREGYDDQLSLFDDIEELTQVD